MLGELQLRSSRVALKEDMDKGDKVRHAGTPVCLEGPIAELVKRNSS